VTEYMVVRSEDRTVALPVAAVEEVFPLDRVLAAPGVLAAVRGVVPVRERLLPVAHLGALLADAASPGHAGATGVVVTTAGGRIVLEVDDAEDLVATPTEALPHGWRGLWATTAIRRAGVLIPVVDVAWLTERLVGAGTA
jgi:chemotaxis signal transduction protein